ncbi:MAG: GNAT family N-acetyltransferase [Candidatus Marinimicrobia bacterium]|nr:GNAT family N-acetyltransferase [Candidatus Neomarinimicrobiota bacterium]
MKPCLRDYRIVPMHDHPGGLDEAISYYHRKWGRENNLAFFKDAIEHANDGGLPQFFVLLKGKRIVGCCGLIANDLISRQDLCPWLCGLFVETGERGRGLGNFLLEFAEKEARRVGYDTVYLSTDHTAYYERYGWAYLGDGYEPSGEPARIYRKILA